MAGTQPKQQNPLGAVFGLLGAAAGWGLSQYCGENLFIPGAATVVLLLVFLKTPIHPKYFRGAIAVTGGHVVWFTIAAVMLHNWAPVLLDVILLTACAGLLWALPSLWTALPLALVQLGSLAFNISVLMQAQPGSVGHRALTAHCVFRLVAIIGLVTGYLRMRREKAQAAPGFPVMMTSAGGDASGG